MHVSKCLQMHLVRFGVGWEAQTWTVTMCSVVLADRSRLATNGAVLTKQIYQPGPGTRHTIRPNDEAGYSGPTCIDVRKVRYIRHERELNE